MAIAAHFETASPSGETRRQPRRTLLLEALGATAGDEATSVLIHNISATGLLLECEAPLDEGETLEIELPEAGVATASVIWASGRFFGCQFETPISPAALSAAQLRAAPEGELALSAPRSASEGSFGAVLARLRKERGLTLSRIASELGVSKPTVWAWEQGKARPIDSRMDALARVLGVARSELTPHHAAPLLGDSLGLGELLARSRQQIAVALGTSPDRVKIILEL